MQSLGIELHLPFDLYPNTSVGEREKRGKGESEERTCDREGGKQGHQISSEKNAKEKGSI